MNRYILYVIAGYLSGSVLYARVMCHLFGGDEALLHSKDCNPGTSNAFACGGFACGVLTLVGDLMKGIVPVWLYVRSGEDITPTALALVLAAPVVGHAFPCFYGFHGGKGIAVSFGCLLGLLPFWTPVLLLACIFIFYSTILRITPNLSRTRVTYLTLPLGMLLMEVPLWICFGTLCMTGMVLVRLHISTEEREKPAVHLLWWT